MAKTPDVKDVVKSTRKSIKSKIRRLVCCASWWLVAAIVFVVVGIVLLVFYAKHWGSTEKTLEAALAYLGVAFLGVGAILLLIAIILFVVFRNILQINRRKAVWNAPVYPYGEAPYPQQKLAAEESIATIAVAETQAVPDTSYTEAPQEFTDIAPPPPPLP